MTRPLFTLDDRLKLCADFVRQGALLADIGTDHAYLPVYLYKTGRIKRAIAADLRPGPLMRAKQTVEKYSAEDGVETRLSDGLLNINSKGCTDIVIAGMGGELIASILEKSKWVQDKEKRLILQPMSRAERLREYLFENGFNILCEQTAKADGKVYSAMLCTYCGSKAIYTAADIYVGRLKPQEIKLDKAYVQNIISALKRKQQGLEAGASIEEAEKTAKLVDVLQSELGTNKE